MKSKQYIALLSVVIASGAFAYNDVKADELPSEAPGAAPTPPQASSPMEPEADVNAGKKPSDFSADVGASFGWGDMGVSQGDLPSRSMFYISLMAFPNYRLNSLIESLPFPLKIGVLAEYRFVEQLTSASSLSNDSNFKGETFLVGVGLQSDFNRFSVGASFDFLGSHSFSNPSQSAASTGYHSPLGFRLIGSYEALKNFYPGLMLGYESFGTFVENGNSVDASSDRLNEFTIGLNLAYRLNF